MENIKIILADDHQIVIDGIQSILTNDPNIEVVGTANNGVEVIALLKESSVDVVILDISMPVLGGIETSKQILKAYPKSKILLLTMEGDSQYIINAMRLGIHGYIIKEKSKDTLINAIHSVHRGATYWPPELIARISDPRALYEDEVEVPNLTEREQEVLNLLVENPSFTSEEIGRQLHIAKYTVDTHIRNMKSKLKLKKRNELVKYALEKRK